MLNNKVKIPEWELEFRADRSSGPGGQNVNKTATKVTVRFDVDASKSLNDEQKRLVKKNLSGHLNKEGEIVIYEQSSRSQWQNRKTVISRLNELGNEAVVPEKERKETRAPKGVKERGLQEKKLHSSKKELRRKVDKDQF
jgi:ribosome-associated protein